MLTRRNMIGTSADNLAWGGRPRLAQARRRFLATFLIQPSRRGLMRAAALVALLSAASVQVGRIPARAEVAAAHLIVADVQAARVYVYGAGGAFPLVATFDDIALGAHAGAVALKDGRVLIPDDRNKQLVVLRLATEGAPTIERRVPMPIPLPTRYAWAAVDPGATVLAATGLDADESVKLLTLVDLKTYASKQFRVDSGSPDAEVNLAVGGEADPVVFLHLAERVDAYKLSDLMKPDAKINGILDGTIKPSSSLAVGKGGHSNSFSGPTKKWTGSTLRGFEIATLEADGKLVGHKTLSWEADERGGGRNPRQRLTTDGKHVFGPLHAAVPPTQWAEAQVDLHWVDLAAERTRRLPLALGAVGRGGVSARFAVYASIHPNGDHANIVDMDSASPTFRQVTTQIALPKLAEGPVAGQPTTGRESRYSAILPDGRLAFVSQGGEGKIHIIDTAGKAILRTIQTPTPLKGGGYLIGVQVGAASADFSAR